MWAWTRDFQLKHYKSALEIITDFVPIRLEYYVKRKEYQLQKLKQCKKIIENQAKFVSMIVGKTLIVKRRKIQAIIDDLRSHGFDPMSALKKMVKQSNNNSEDSDEKNDDEEEEDNKDDDEEDDDDEEAEGGSSNNKKDFDYLLSMSLLSLTKEKVDELRRDLQNKKSEREELEKKTPEMLWLTDLEKLEVDLEAEDVRRAKDREE